MGALTAVLAMTGLAEPWPEWLALPHGSVGGTVVLSLMCHIDRTVATIDCTPALPAGASYAAFASRNLVIDTNAHTWEFAVKIQNLLGQSIGTVDGSTIAGVHAVVTDVRSAAGSGTVIVANADGQVNVTAPNQPFFDYHQIVAPHGFTSETIWRFNVPNAVTAIDLSILVVTDFAAEQGVTLAPPTSYPDWIHADSNISDRTDSIHVRFVKRILMVRFRPGATLADRQLAVALVNGVVVGGSQNPDGVTGFYYIQIADDGTGAPLFAAGRKLARLPQVASAIPEIILDEQHFKTKEGGTS